MAYTVEITGGRTTTHETYEEALGYAERQGAQVTEHPGDLTEGGDRTLLWESEEAAENDPGVHAMGVIRHVED